MVQWYIWFFYSMFPVILIGTVVTYLAKSPLSILMLGSGNSVIGLYLVLFYIKLSHVRAMGSVASQLRGWALVYVMFVVAGILRIAFIMMKIRRECREQET